MGTFIASHRAPLCGFTNLILVTVGTQLPFDRLIRIMDDIAPTIGQPIVAQTANGSYTPRHLTCHSMVDPVEFEQLFARASLIVAHAGVGTVLMAQKHQKPIIAFPRRAALGEHRNEHQLATIAALEHRQGIYVARTAEVLLELLAQKLEPPLPAEGSPNRREFVHRLSTLIDDQARLPARRNWLGWRASKSKG